LHRKYRPDGRGRERLIAIVVAATRVAHAIFSFFFFKGKIYVPVTEPVTEQTLYQALILRKLSHT